MLASDVMDESRALLNDVSGAVYTNTVILPFLIKAWLELQNKYIQAGIPYPQAISAPITVNALALTLTLPTDFVLPIQLRERTPNDVIWNSMIESRWEPDDLMLSTLDVWSFRDGAINFRGATTARQVKLYYYKTLASVTVAASTIPYLEIKSCLAARTAALVAKFIMQDSTRASELDADALFNYSIIEASKIKQQQSLPVRRLPYKWSAARRRPWIV